MTTMQPINLMWASLLNSPGLVVCLISILILSVFAMTVFLTKILCEHRFDGFAYTKKQTSPLPMRDYTPIHPIF